MIRSMTGFAAATREGESATVSLAIRSVNHRHLDIQVKAPTALASREPMLRRAIQQHLTRGRIELMVTVSMRWPPVPEIEVNEPFLSALVSALERARASGLITGALSPGDLVRHPQALIVREVSDPVSAGDQRELAELVDVSLHEALAKLVSMKSVEGAELQADLDERLRATTALIERAARAAEAGRSDLETRLTRRVRELRVDPEVDEAAIATEIVRTAARSDITEELVRFRAHLNHWHLLANGPEPCGRRLDFLIQEMHREANTMGSKADGIDVPELIVGVKAELERMREQVQNVE
jgi:uncharacterized protein (TIGR00255 family)